MRVLARSLTVLVAAGAASVFATASMGQSAQAPGTNAAGEQSAASTPNTDWPCDQPLRPEMSMGAMWQGPDPTKIQTDWHTIPAVVALIDEVAPRRVPQDDAVANIRRFAAGYQGTERSDVLTALFAGLFDTLSKERNDIVNGIKHYSRRQDSLAQSIEDGWKALGEIDANTTDPHVVEQRLTLQQQVDWNSRIFDDRQRLLPVVCEQPRILEQRVFALSRAIQQQLSSTQ